MMKKRKALPALILALLFLSACGPKEAAVTPTPSPTPSPTPRPTPTLRTLPPSPSPTPAPEYTNYTLTDLGKDSGVIGAWCYPVLLGDQILTLDGRAVDYPPGQLIGGTSIDTKGEYCQLFLTAENYPHDTGHCAVLIDAAGDFPFPAWSGHDYDYLAPLSEGGFVAANYDDGDNPRWYLLSAGGAVEKTLPDRLEYAGGQAYNGGWYSYNEGLCPRQDGANGRWGYVDGEGQWVLPPQWTWANSFSNGRAIAETGNGLGVIDATGKLLFSVRKGQDLTAGYVSPGCDAPMRYRWDERMGGGDCGWLDADGNTVPGPGRDIFTGTRASYQNGYFYDGQTYYDLSGQPCSETFDWCGPLSADGRGFVSLSGRVYRIEFNP